MNQIKKNRLKFELLQQRERLFERWLEMEHAQRDLSVPGPVRLKIRQEMPAISEQLREMDSLFLPKTNRDQKSTR